MSIAERLVGHLHPRLLALSYEPSGEAAFWEDMAAARTPLVEPDPARPGYSLVTYVMPMPESARHVVVQPGFGQPTDNVMDRIAGTNVCHASYRYRNDVRATYGFYPDMPLLAYEQASDAEVKANQEAMRTIVAVADPHHREVFVNRASSRPDILNSILGLPDAPDQPYFRAARGRGARQGGRAQADQPGVGQRTADLGLYAARL